MRSQIKNNAKIAKKEKKMVDNKQVLICPACGKVMEKVYMPEQGVNIDVCLNGCGGIYFDNREFEKFDEPHENIDNLVLALEGKTFEKADEAQTRVCPVCGAKMVKNHSSIKKEVQIDECYSCGGKFLDYGELQKIRAEYNTESERRADVVKAVYSTVGVEIPSQNANPVRKIFDSLVFKN